MQANNHNEQLVLDFFKALNTGDLEIIRATLHENASWTPMVRGVPGEGTHAGRSAIVDGFLGPVRGLFKPGDPKNTVESLASNGSLVIAESHGTGTLADGRPYDNRYCWAIEIKDDKIFALREYMDSLYVMRLFEKPSA